LAEIAARAGILVKLQGAAARRHATLCCSCFT